MTEQSSSISIERIDSNDDSILVNLFEHYLHDMAEWFPLEVGNDGRYAYDTMPHWQNDDPIYLARVGGALAGFAIVASAERWTNDPLSLDVREFFVIRRHRRSRVGQAMANTVWDTHRGSWLVRVIETNQPAVPFWRKVVAAYTNGAFTEQVVVPGDGKHRLFFSFDNRRV